MRSINKPFCLFLIMFLFTSLLVSGEGQKIKLTSKEEQFIREHPLIVLGIDKGWMPFVFVNQEGKVSGLERDILDRITEVSGLKFELRAGRWKDMVAAAQRKEIDGLCPSIASPERARYFNFSVPHMTLRGMLIVAKSNPKNIKSLDDLKGKTIAIQRSNADDENYVKRFSESAILRLDSMREVIESVLTGRADAYIGSGISLYFSKELGFPYLEMAVPLNRDTLERHSLRNDYPELLSIVNKSLLLIGEEELLRLKNYWFQTSEINNNLLDLSSEEEKYLKGKKEIKMCVDPDWMPFEKIENGRYIGLGSEYMKHLQNGIGVPLRLIPTKTWSESLDLAKKRECDILAMAAKTPQREEYLDFSAPYVNVPIVVATKAGYPFIEDISEIMDRKLGVVKDYSFYERFKKLYPSIDLVEVGTAEDGLKKVKSGEIFGYIDNHVVINELIQKEFPGIIAISGRLKENLELSIASRNDEKILGGILNNFILTIKPITKQSFYDKWVLPLYKERIDYTLLYQVIFAALVIIGVTLYWNRRLNAEIRQTEMTKQRLKESEEKFRTLFDLAPVMIDAFDDEGRCVLWNKECEKVFGWTMDEVNGHEHPLTLFYPDPGNRQKGRKSMATRENNVFREWHPLDKEGNAKVTLWANVLLPNNECINVGLDITEQRAAEREAREKTEQLIKTEKLLSEANSMLKSRIDQAVEEIRDKEILLQHQSRLAQMGEMLGMIAHQWRQPLSAVSAAVFGVETRLAFTQSDLDNRQTREEFIAYLRSNFEFVQEHTQRMSDTIDDFRNFFKEQTEPERTTLSDVARKALQMIGPLLGNKLIEIKEHFESRTPILLYRNELIHVLLNLLKNAEDAFSDNGIKEPVITLHSYEEEEHCIIMICDNAGGIAPKIAERIFDPYFSTKLEKNGTGLGLYMSKMIIEDHHHGVIEHRNTADGSCFTIKLRIKG